jgi:outer membrane protein TolC
MRNRKRLRWGLTWVAGAGLCAGTVAGVAAPPTQPQLADFPGAPRVGDGWKPAANRLAGGTPAVGREPTPFPPPVLPAQAEGLPPPAPAGDQAATLPEPRRLEETVPPGGAKPHLPGPDGFMSITPGALEKILAYPGTPIDLASALSLAGVRNPEVLLFRQRVLEAIAQRQQAAAMILPNINLGGSYDNHNGNLQQSSGNIIKVDRESVFFGAGAYAIAAGTVNIPGVSYNLNVGDAIFTFLESRQNVARAEFASRAAELDALRRVGVAYMDLLEAEGRLALARLTVENAGTVARQTAEWAQPLVGVRGGRPADARRAESELRRRQFELREAEGQAFMASARLARLLNLDPSVRLVPIEQKVVPMPIVPAPIPLGELVAIALLNRPEMAEQQAAIQQALLALRGAKLLPFSPNIIIGLSYGGYGGGSNLASEPPPPVPTTATSSQTTASAGAAPPVPTNLSPFGTSQPRFRSPMERLDFDAVAYWSLQNFGLGNLAMIKQAGAQVNISRLELLATMDMIRAQVADAYVRSHARFAQIGTAEQAVGVARKSYEEDTLRIKNDIRGSRPIELLNSLRLLIRGRYAYLEAIMGYNRAQLELYTALGRPPAKTLARPVEPGFVPPGELAQEARDRKQERR